MNLYIDVDGTNPAAAPGKGPIPADLAIVGIAPSKARPLHRINEPFGSKSWAALQSILARFPEQKIYVTNLVKVPVDSGDNPKKAEITYYYHRLMRELAFVKPKRILAMGAPVAKVLCPSFDSMREDHGTLFRNPELGCIVVPTYHFSAVARNRTLKSLLANDLHRFFTLPDPPLPDYRVLDSVPTVLPEGSRVYLDIETNSLDPRDGEITLIGFKSNLQSWVRILPKPTPEDLRQLFETVKRCRCTLVGHHFQFDLGFMEEKGNFHWEVPVKDTLIMASGDGEESLSLKHLTSFYTSRPGSRAFGSTEDLGYLAEDVLSTEAIHDSLEKRLRRPGRADPFFVDLIHELLPEVVGMRKRGIYVDREMCKRDGAAQREKVTEAAGWLSQKAQADINWNSDQQLVKLLQERGYTLTKKTKKGAFQVNEAVMLELLAHYGEDSLPGYVLKYREVVKALEFYDKYLEMTTDAHPYLHPRLILHGARTGRTSCSDPNLQQVPREGPIKLLFRSRWEDGLFSLIDLSQAELRVACLLADDPVMAEALMAGDIHAINASIAYKIPLEQVTATQRKRIKGITFGVLYGGTPYGLALKVGVGVKEVEMILSALFGRYRKLKEWYDATIKYGQEQLEIFDLFGRRRDLSPIMMLEGENGVARKAVNTPVQGLASHIDMMILLYVSQNVRVRKLKSRPLISVHDSVLGEVYPGENDAVATIVQEAFENLANSPLSTRPLFQHLPFEGELYFGKSWAHVESTNEAYDPGNNIVIPVSSLPHVSLAGGRAH